MSDHDGQFNEWKPCSDLNCSKCGSSDVVYREWESSCGGYVDEKYRCNACKHTWWIEGPDA